MQPSLPLGSRAAVLRQAPKINTTSRAQAPRVTASLSSLLSTTLHPAPVLRSTYLSLDCCSPRNHAYESTEAMAAATSSAPTLAGAFSYPPPSVPPTANAAYQQSSGLPENFVFIVVGAALGFIVLVIFVWRLMSSWAMNRNSKKFASSGAAGAHYTPLPDLKKNPAMQSSHDMADLSKLPKSFSSVPSLFFSPTAEVARQSQRPPSHHLPAGHYRDGSDPARR